LRDRSPAYETLKPRESPGIDLPSPDTTKPVLTFAAIDVGSNAVRLVVARLSSAGRLLDSTYRRYNLRIGTDVFSHGAIRRQDAANLLEVFEDIAARLDGLGVDRYRAVGTSAMREAKNGPQLVKRLARATGLNLQIIDGTEESDLARFALVRAVGWAPPATLVVDLGGGTLELGRVGGRANRSVPLGTVRLIEEHPALKAPLSPGELTPIKDAIGKTLARHTTRGALTELAVGTGGNFDVLSRVLPCRGSTMPSIEVRRLLKLAKEIAPLSIAERVERYDLRPDRAEVILPTVLILNAIGQRFGVRTLVAPGTGLREAVLHKLAEPASPSASAAAVLKRLGQPLGLSRRHAQLAEALFRVLAPIHGLWRPGLVPLSVAAWLREVGTALDPNDPAAHTAYVIRNASGLNLDDDARAIAAHAAAGSWSTDPTPTYDGLAPADADVTRRIEALLRLSLAIAAAGGTKVHGADLLHRPLTLDCGLSRALPRQGLALIQRWLGCSLLVR